MIRHPDSIAGPGRRDVPVLFVHGLGRSSASGWFMLRRLRRAGYRTSTFDYNARREDFMDIAERLASAIRPLLRQGAPVLVGHSLGGVLLRQALDLLGEDGHKARHLFLLGSPVVPSRMARRLAGNLFFRAFTRDCGRLLCSVDRMSFVAAPRIPTTGVAGTCGIARRHGPFGLEPNDGVVSLSEVSAPWLEDQVLLSVLHTLLPVSRQVTKVILSRVES